ncbi:hypothetical protein G9A89_014147 [Geosiphon pyriformis]|nr:hypothetical protein G9A89_014147 [Geosiphon pyriformis]
MGVPILDRLQLRDYQALFVGITFLLLETLLRVVTWCLPTIVLEFCKAQSQKVFSQLYVDQRTQPAKILQHTTTFKEMAAYWGYKSEEHIVRTQDQYILGIQRIPEGHSNKLVTNNQKIVDIFERSGIPVSAIRIDGCNSLKGVKPVVLLYHGLMMCSEVWMCNLEEERRLACLLVDAGYDVWFGNARGNKYSMKHTHYKPNERRFWEYSMDECALYDLPDTVDYILETTGAPSLAYIGFSQGTALQFAALSVSPKLNKKVNLFIALAPATSPKGLQNPLVDAFIKASPDIIYLFFGRKAFLPMTLFWQKVLSPPIFTKVLDTSMKFLFGWEGKNMTEVQRAVSYSHLYSLASVKSLVHWFQIMRASNFQMYDDLPTYSSKGAVIHTFPTQQIKTPIAVFYGGSDSLVNIEVLLKQLPKPVLVQEVKEYEHLDFLWASEVHKKIFPQIFDLLRIYNVHMTAMPAFKTETARLNVFLTDCLSLGCLKGFKHFELYLRGREELLLRVYNIGKPTSDRETSRRSYNSLSLAKSQSNALFSPRTFRNLSNGSISEAILPPNSPLDQELERDTSKTVFLIAGYARYKRPYVWLRSNHKRLIQLQDDQKIETDNPLKLETLADWKNQNIMLWDIIAEIISLSLSPPPANPFEIDHTYYDTLPLEESAVITGAMANFLQKVYLKDTPYADKIFEDIKIILQRHFAAFEEMNDALNNNTLEKSNPTSSNFSALTST